MGAKRHIFTHPFWILIFCLRSISYIPPWMSAWKRLPDVRFWNFQWSLSFHTTWKQRIAPPDELFGNQQAKIILNIRCKLTRKQSCNQSSGRAWCGVKFLKWPERNWSKMSQSAPKNFKIDRSTGKALRSVLRPFRPTVDDAPLSSEQKRSLQLSINKQLIMLIPGTERKTERNEDSSCFFVKFLNVPSKIFDGGSKANTIEMLTRRVIC